MGFLGDLLQGPQLTPREEILKAFNNPKAIIVDVRSPGEIRTKVDAKKWINAPGTLLDCPMLANEAARLFPNKTTPIIVYCASGKRSHKAATILKEQGYQLVFNAGGIGDLNYLPITAVS
jgi:rhodanese-related sulfurtransferase